MSKEETWWAISILCFSKPGKCNLQGWRCK